MTCSERILWSRATTEMFIAINKHYCDVVPVTGAGVHARARLCFAFKIGKTGLHNMSHLSYNAERVV